MGDVSEHTVSLLLFTSDAAKSFGMLLQAEAAKSFYVKRPRRAALSKLGSSLVSSFGMTNAQPKWGPQGRAQDRPSAWD